MPRKMFNWAKQTLANVAGTPEPIYGSSAIQSVAQQAEKTPYTEVTKKNLTWEAMDSTCVETQIFYLFAETGHIAWVQVIYSNVVGIKTTCQFNSKIFYPKSEKKENLFCSDPLKDHDFNEDHTSFYAENLAVELSEDGKSYSIKSMVNEASIVNVTIKQTSPGYVVGEDGKSYYGTNPKEPWGYIKHAFWPRNTCEGEIVTKDGPLNFKGKAMFIHANQAMKPHHAAGKWTFADFQSEHYAAIMMEYITPPSYGSTKVTLGGLVKDGEIICANASGVVTHTKIKGDSLNDWPEPESVKLEWVGKTKDGKDVEAVLEGPLDDRLDRVDVMAHVPGFVKQIVAASAGTKPYIYQYSPSESSLKIKVGDEEVVEKGVLYAEATFICA